MFYSPNSFPENAKCKEFNSFFFWTTEAIPAQGKVKDVEVNYSQCLKHIKS